MTPEEKITWRIKLEEEYVLICKNCHRKVFDPCKSNINQIFTKSKCPHCGFCKDQEKKSKKFKAYAC